MVRKDQDFMKMPTNNSNRHRIGAYKLRIVAFALLSGALGGAITIRSHAATPTVNIEAEAGSTSCNNKITDSSASASSAVKFATCVASGNFVHPGILVGTSQLDFVKAKIAAGEQPWASAYSRMIGSSFGSLSYTAHPAAVVSRNNYATNKSSAGDLQLDDIAAYTDALAYYYTGNVQYADKAISIMNAWSATLSSVDSTGQLDAAWAAEMFPRAAEIIRYTYSPSAGHTSFDSARFATMLTNVLLPQLDQNSNGSTYSNGNWELSMTEGEMNIGVYTNNRTLFDNAVSRWRTRVPAYFYESSDGAVPVYPPGGKYSSPQLVTCFWVTGGSHTTSCALPSGFAFHDGMSQETCRDISHVVFGLEAAANSAETARLQNLDLYGEQQDRLKDAYEFAAKYDAQALANPNSAGTGGAVQDTICGGALAYNGGGYTTGFEIAYNQFAGRKGLAMPYTKKMIDTLRPTPATLHMAWETLTSAGTP